MLTNLHNRSKQSHFPAQIYQVSHCLLSLIGQLTIRPKDSCVSGSLPEKTGSVGRLYFFLFSSPEPKAHKVSL